MPFGTYYFVTSHKLTYADQLNNIEWKGYGVLTGTAVRSFNTMVADGWGPWSDHDPGSSPQPDAYI